jgi:ankyrin repeat protein
MTKNYFYILSFISLPLFGLAESYLHDAVKKGSADEVERLLKNGANLKLCIENGGTAWEVAISEDKPAIMELFFKYGLDPEEKNAGKLSMLYLAAMQKRCKIMELILTKRARPDGDGIGESPLHYLAASKEYSLVTRFAIEILLKHKADPKKCGAGNKSPFDVANPVIQSLMQFYLDSGKRERERRENELSAEVRLGGGVQWS